MPNSDDDSPLSRAVAGDRAAQELLLLSHSRRLVQYLTPRVPDLLRGLVSADDVLQDTFVKAFRGMGQGQFDSEGAFFAWLRTIADRCLADTIKAHHRKKRAADVRPAARAAADEQSLLTLLGAISDGGSTPSSIVGRREAVSALQVALAGLPEEYRQVIRLRYLEGKSPEEVAAKVNQPFDVVRGQLYRAKKKLREAMGRASLYFSKG